MPRTVGSMTSRMTRACTLGRDHRRRRIRAHAAGVGPGVAVVERACGPAQVASGSACLPSTIDDEARFLAVEEFLDHHALAGSAELVAGEHACRSRRAASASVVATTTPLPAARPSALITIGAPLRVARTRARPSASVNVCVVRGRDAVALQEILGEGLGAFELRGRLRGAEEAQARGAERVDHARDQRRLRARRR